MELPGHVVRCEGGLQGLEDGLAVVAGVDHRALDDLPSLPDHNHAGNRGLDRRALKRYQNA